MLRFVILFSIFIPVQTVQSQPLTEYAETTCHGFQVVTGMEYRISVTPEQDSDTVVGVESDPDKPMTVLNGKGAGFIETYNMQAVTDELQVCVYSSTKDSKNEVVVIGEDQLFPFFMWSGRGSVALGRDKNGMETTYRFNRVRRRPVQSRAAPYGKQQIAADSGIQYSFEGLPNLPYDLIVVPETNHLDLAVHAITENGLETSDNDRSAENLLQTNAGQVEWLQVRPKEGLLEVVVANKSSFGGSFLVVLKSSDESKLKFLHASSKYLSAYELDSFVVRNRGDLPYISGTRAATFEITPDRLVENYMFSAVAIEPGLNFAMIVRTAPDKPPIFVQAGGSYTRSASFRWSVVAGQAFLDLDNRIRRELSGYPTPGAIEISIVSYGGIGNLNVSLQDSVTLRNLLLPRNTESDPRYVTSLLHARYGDYQFIDGNIRLYRYRSDPGKTYKVQVLPDSYFDPILMDPSIRNFDKPNALASVDENGRGQTEVLELKAKEDFIEFGVGSVRYENGIVNVKNKRLGGIGFYTVRVTDEMGGIPELIETSEAALPNQLISKELDLDFVPWDNFKAKTASNLPPHPTVFDERLLKAFDRPLNAKAL